MAENIRKRSSESSRRDSERTSAPSSSRDHSERTSSPASTARSSVTSGNNDGFLGLNGSVDADVQDFQNKSVEKWLQTVESQPEGHDATNAGLVMVGPADDPKTLEEGVHRIKTLFTSMIDSIDNQSEKVAKILPQYAALWEEELARLGVWWGEIRQCLSNIEMKPAESGQVGSITPFLQDLDALANDLIDGLEVFCSEDSSFDLVDESPESSDSARLLMTDLHDAVHANISGLFKRNKLFRATTQRTWPGETTGNASIRGLSRNSSEEKKTEPNTRLDSRHSTVNQTRNITPLEKEFKRTSSKFFVVGRVFHMMHSEEGRNETGKKSLVWSVNTYGQWIHTKPRRFVVVRTDARTCLAVPITTYEGEGVAKSMIKKSDHCIAYTGQKPPSPTSDELPGPHEEGMQPTPIRIEVDDPMFRLDPMSRIDFAKPRTVSHDTLVKRFGRVHSGSIKALIDQFRAVLDPKRPERTEPIQLSSPPAGPAWPSILDGAEDRDRRAYQALVKDGVFTSQEACEYVWGFVQARRRAEASPIV